MSKISYALTEQDIAECLAGVLDDHEVAAILIGNTVIPCLTSQDVTDAVFNVRTLALTVRLKTGMPPEDAAEEMARRGRHRGSVAIILPDIRYRRMSPLKIEASDQYLQPGYPPSAGTVAYLTKAFKLRAKHALCRQSGERCPVLASDEIKRQMEEGLRVSRWDPDYLETDLIPHKWFKHPPPWYTPSPDPKYIKPKASTRGGKPTT